MLMSKTQRSSVTLESFEMIAKTICVIEPVSSHSATSKSVWLLSSIVGRKRTVHL